MTDVDPFVTEAVEALAARDRVISSLSRDVATLLTALARYEGGNVAEVSYRRLGRCQELTALWGDPEPEWPQWRGEWSATADYLVGDHVSRGGIVYRCLVAHGAAYAGTWGPPTPGAWVVASQ